MSKQLSDLEAAVACAGSPGSRALAQSRLAYHLPRYSCFAEARDLIAKVRTKFSDGHDPVVLLWIMLAEGLVEHYEALEGNAKDRVQRAYVLSKALRLDDIVAHSACWRALIEFNDSDFARMQRSIEEALQAMEGCSDPFVESRICLIAFMCSSLCNRQRDAQRWVAAAQQRALSIGDRGTIEALLYNRAAMSLGRLRAQACIRQVSEDELSLVQSELSSARNYFKLTQHRATARLLELCDLRLLVLRRRFVEGSTAIDAFLSDARYVRRSFNRDVLLLEQLYCKVESEVRLDEAVASTVIEAVEYVDLEPDERLVATWMAKTVLDRLGIEHTRQSADARFQFALEVFDSTYAELGHWLDDMSSSKLGRRLLEGHA